MIWYGILRYNISNVVKEANMVTRTAEDQKAGDYLRAGENLREAYNAIENAYRR